MDNHFDKMRHKLTASKKKRVSCIEAFFLQNVGIPLDKCVRDIRLEIGRKENYINRKANSKEKKTKNTLTE